MLCRGESNCLHHSFGILISSMGWDPHLAKDVRWLECVLRRAARFVKNDYRRTTSVTSLLNQLEWSPLSVCWRNSRLVAFYKVVNNLQVCSSSWSTASLLSSNQVVWPTDIQSSDSLNYDYYKYSFLPCTIVDWNSLPFSLRAKPSVKSFRADLQHLTEQNHNTPAVTGNAHSWILHRSAQAAVTMPMSCIAGFIVIHVLRNRQLEWLSISGLLISSYSVCEKFYSKKTSIRLVFATRCYATVAYVIMQCLSVCVCVTFMNSVKTNKHIIKIFSPSGSHTILVFPCQTA